MRQKIDNYHLQTSVNLICRLKNNFSYYDITKAVRNVLPQYNISHEDVKTVVNDFLKNTIYSVVNNGQYNVFTVVNKNTPVVKQQSKLAKLMAEKKRPKSTVNPIVVNRQKVFTEAVVKQQLENRINATSFVRKIFGNNKVVIEKFSTIIKIYTPKVGQKIPLNSTVTNALREIRIRTGFTSDSVLIRMYNDLIEITPK